MLIVHIQLGRSVISYETSAVVLKIMDTKFKQMNQYKFPLVQDVIFRSFVLSWHVWQQEMKKEQRLNSDNSMTMESLDISLYTYRLVNSL